MVGVRSRWLQKLNWCDLIGIFKKTLQGFLVLFIIVYSCTYKLVIILNVFIF
jgi:hypothetical protein